MEMVDKDLSIIISTWNSMKYLPECINSIKKMEIPQTEIIVVDGASNDGTREYLASKGDSIKTLRSNNRLTWSDANQIGLDVSKGEWICLSNPDIVFSSSFSELFREIQDSEVQAAVPQLIFPNGKIQPPAKVYTPELSLCAHTRLVGLILKTLGKNVKSVIFPYKSSKTEFPVDAPQGSLFLIHRSVLDKMRGRLWNPGYLNNVSDIEAFLNLKRLGVKIWLFPQFRVIHYGSYVTKRYPGWVEKDQAYGLVLYFRYNPDLSQRISPELYSLLFGLEAVAIVVVDILGRLLSKNPFFNPRLTGWIAGQRLIGLVQGWRYRIP